MQRMRHKTTVIQRDLDRLGARWRSEADHKFASVRLERFTRERDAGRSAIGIRALEVGRRVDLDAEFRDVVFRGCLAGNWGEQRLFDGVGASDHDGAVEKKECDGVVETGDRGAGACGPALAEFGSRVVDERFEGGVGGESEALSTAVATVEEDDCSVGEQGAFDHAAAFGHRVHFPSSGGGERLDAAATGVGRARDVLVGAATTDEDVGSPLTGAGEGQEHASTGVGVRAVVAREIGVGLDGFVPSNVEALSGFRDKYEEVTVGHEVDERIHVVRLILGEDVHWNADTV